VSLLREDRTVVSCKPVAPLLFRALQDCRPWCLGLGNIPDSCAGARRGDNGRAQL